MLESDGPTDSQQRPQARIDHDEIKTYLDTRYVSAPEAVWRTFEFPLHDQSHTIIRLAIHLPHQQPVYFTHGREEQALEAAHDRDTTLTGWFQLNRDDQTARQHHYIDMPAHFVWVKKDCKWKRRERGGSNVIGRMYSVSPQDTERYHLRLLLLHVSGATSFEHLRTVDGQVAATFQEACRLRGLLEDDAEWHRCMAEAAAFRMPRQMRLLLATICIFCNPSDVPTLWSDFKEDLTEDYVRTYNTHQAEQLALADIAAILLSHGFSCATFQLPEPQLVQVSFFSTRFSYLQHVEFGQHYLSHICRFLNDIIRKWPTIQMREGLILHTNVTK